MTTTQNKFNPTHQIITIGNHPDVPCVIIYKRNELWCVQTADGKQYWVGKYNVEEI